VKSRLSKLKNTALNAKSSLTSGDAPKLAQTTAELKAQWEVFSEKAPLAARFHCDTRRRCMKLGFEIHPKLPTLSACEWQQVWQHPIHSVSAVVARGP
jgi:hypothetical protein